MRRSALTLAALAVAGLAAGTAYAGHGAGGHGRSSYGKHSGYVRSSHHSRYGGYGHYGRYSYGRSRGRCYYSNPHLEAVRRIQAKYSSYRYGPHPRSYYRSGRYRYGYWGW